MVYKVIIFLIHNFHTSKGTQPEYFPYLECKLKLNNYLSNIKKIPNIKKNHDDTKGPLKTHHPVIQIH